MIPVLILYLPFHLLLPQKRFAEASEVYLEGIENCPDSSDLHNNYGVFLVDTGEVITSGSLPLHLEIKTLRP